MKQWFWALPCLLAASAAAVVLLGAKATEKADEQPVTLTMKLGEAADFAPVTLKTVQGYDLNYPNSWWEQEISFGENIQTESHFYSTLSQTRRQQAGRALFDRDHLSFTSNSVDEMMASEEIGWSDGYYKASDYLDKYEYTANFHGRRFGTDFPFPWLTTAVEEEDYTEIERHANGNGVYFSNQLSVVDCDTVPIELEDGWYFTLPNTFHGLCLADRSEPVRYEGSSGVFFLPTNEEGEFYTYNSEDGWLRAEQLYAIPVSSELDTVVLRMDWMEERGVFCLLMEKGDEFVLQLYDPAARKALPEVTLGEAFIQEDWTYNTCKATVQGDMLLILQGEGTGRPSRAMAVKISPQRETEVLLDKIFDTSGYYDNYALSQSDAGLFWAEDTFYVLETGSYDKAMLYALDEGGLKALGVLSPYMAEQESLGGGYGRNDFPEWLSVPWYLSRGWEEIYIMR